MITPAVHDAGRFAALPVVAQAWSLRLAVLCRRWPEWRAAPREQLIKVGTGWEALQEGQVLLVTLLTEHEIKWAGRASDAWEVDIGAPEREARRQQE